MNIKKEDIDIIAIIIVWSENEEIDNLKHEKIFSANEFIEMCKNEDLKFRNERDNDETLLGYQKNKYQVIYSINSKEDRYAKSITARVDFGDGEQHMPTESRIKDIISSCEKEIEQDM